MPTIDDKLDEIDTAATRLAALWQEVADIATAEGHEDIAKSGAIAFGKRAAQESVPNSVAAVRKDLRELRRPKGPSVELRWTGREREPRNVEVLRRTDKRVLLNDSYRGTWYDIERGHEVPRPRDVYLGEWRITDAGLETIRAMSVGENDVSRALKAAKNGGA